MIFAAQHPVPRFAPRWLRIMCETVFKELYGYDMEVEQYGKPTQLTFDYAERHVRNNAEKDGIEISRFYMIGDTPESDISGANSRDWTTILVRTGVFDPKAKTSTADGNDK